MTDITQFPIPANQVTEIDSARAKEVIVGVADSGLSQAEITASTSPDKRSISAYFKDSGGLKTVAWWGDSTTEQMDGLGFVQYDGGYNSGMARIEPRLVGSVDMYNYGGVGRTLLSVSAVGEDLNGGGNNIRINGVGEFISSKVNPLVVICFGLNDCRNDAAIAGSSYGDAAQLAKVTELRGLLSQVCSDLAIYNPDVSFILRMPNITDVSSSFFENGVTGVEVGEILRLTYRGDVSLSIPSISDEIDSSILFDVQNILTGDKARSYGLLNADGLHPNSDGYTRMLGVSLNYLASRPSNGMESVFDAGIRKASGDVSLHGYANTAGNDMFISDEYVQVASVETTNVQPTYFDLSFLNTELCSAAWGNSSGNPYGEDTQPGFGVGDLILFSNGYRLFVDRMGDANQGVYIRWFSGSPDGSGSYPDSADLPSGTTGVLYRNKKAFSDQARKAELYNDSFGLISIASKKVQYNAFITSSSVGSITIQGVAGMENDLSLHTLGSQDTLCISGVSDNASLYDGIDLSSATIVTGSNPAEYDITLSGYDFTANTSRQCVILSDS